MDASRNAQTINDRSVFEKKGCSDEQFGIIIFLKKNVSHGSYSFVQGPFAMLSVAETNS